MSKMSGDLLESMNRFGVGQESDFLGEERGRKARAAAGSRL